jgi:hypothetical protein
MIGSGSYNGFQAKLDRKMSKGLQYTLAYTWSHTLDNSNAALSNGAGGYQIGAGGIPLLKYSYGNSNTDQRHLFVGSMLYELPFGRHGTFLNEVPKAVDYVIGGWQWNNVLTLATGTPLDVTFNGSHPDYHGGCSVHPEYNVWMSCPTKAFGYFNPSTNAWDQSMIAGAVGTLGRNYFQGPGTHTWDTTLSKNFAITERVKTEFRVQVYNLLNTPQFQNPDGNLNDKPNTGLTSGFGVLTAPRSQSNRELELALRVSF